MRSIWKGGISFGLVYIPVKLYSAVNAQHNFDLDMLRKKDLCPIRYARVCKSTGEEVPWNEIVKGYKYGDGDYIVLQDEDFEKANVKRSKTIEIVEFININEVDPKYFEKPYFLEPDKQAKKTYALLVEALKKSKKAGLAKFVLRNREHLGIIMPGDNVLTLNQIRYADELRSPDALDLPEKGEKPSKKELELALTLIDQLSEQFKPEKYKDTYHEEMEKIIELKAKNKLPKKTKAKAPEATKTNDLMEQLKRSLAKSK